MSFADMPEEELPGAIEALLFVSDEPVNAITLADMLEVDTAVAQQALDTLREHLSAQDSGIQLREVAGGWRLFTHPRYHDLVERYVLSWDTRKLSQAALETLAVIAYNQPITRAGIASVRGVNSDSSVNSLIEKGLVREAGRDSAPGQPILYATTRTFLEKFGLTSLSDMPDIMEFAPDEQTRDLIRERLGMTRPQSEPEQQDSLFGDDYDDGLGDDFADTVVDAIDAESDDGAQSGAQEAWGSLADAGTVPDASSDDNGDDPHPEAQADAEEEPNSAASAFRTLIEREGRP